MNPWHADQLEQRPIADLLPYARNARTHSDAQVAQIAASIAEFGFVNPILVAGDNTLIAGHGRLAAAHKLGLETVPVLVLDHLSDTQRRALIIADNKLAENAGWDTELLALELAELQDSDVDLGLMGFDDAEIDELLAGLDGDGDTDSAGNWRQTPSHPRKPTPTWSPKARSSPVPGDLWLLGRAPPDLWLLHRSERGSSPDGRRTSQTALHQPALRQPAPLHHRRHRRLGHLDAGRLWCGDAGDG